MRGCDHDLLEANAPAPSTLPHVCLTPPRPPAVLSLSLIFIERFLAPSRANCDNFSVCVIVCYGLLMFSMLFSINSQHFHIFVDDL